jgi:hypothetical protein
MFWEAVAHTNTLGDCWWITYNIVTVDAVAYFYSRSHRWVLGDRRVCTTTRVWLRVGLFLLRNFRTGISGRDRSGCGSVCATRKAGAIRCGTFSGHPRISSGNFIRDDLRPSLHYCTVRDCGDRWKCREPPKHIQMSHWSCPEITSILTHESLCIKI